MKFICNKQSICDAISNVSKAVSAKSAITALEGIKLKLSYNILELTGYDLEIGIRTSIEVKSEDTGECILGARLFSEIVRRMPADEICLNIDESMNVTISGSSTEFKICAMPADEYPDLPQIDMNSYIQLSQDALKSMINQTIYAVSVRDTKPVLTGELFDILDGSFNLVAIDGFRLAIRNEIISCPDNYHFVVPSKALNEVSRMLKDDGELLCKIFTNNKHIVFELNGYQVFARLLEGDFHNYKNSISPQYKTEVVVKTRELIDCLERCSLLISEKNKGHIKCRFEDNQIFVECKTGIGHINDEIEAEISGEPLTIGFNNKFALDALKATESDKIRIQMNGGNRPIKILPLKGTSFAFLIMPITLKN